MKTIKELERLKKIHLFIKTENTGTPKEFAKKLNISESQWYNILDNLKLKGFPIRYCRKYKTYLYYDFCDLEVNYSVQLLTQEDKINIIGGKILNYFTNLKVI